MSTEPGEMSKQALEPDFEIEQYIRALGASSSRVRFVMLAIIVASIAAAATFWSERGDAWARHRLTTGAENTAIAGKCKLWDHFDDGIDCARDLEIRGLLQQGKLDIKQQLVKDDILYWYGFTERKCSQVCDAATWLNRYGVRTSDGASRFAEKQQEAYINNVLYVKAPVLGLTFDINDLGLITGVTFAVLMLVMVFYTHRAHENLVLAMWKVQEIAEKEECFDVPGSKANLLYHALAMEQVFTVPPTLARWDDFKYFRRAHYLLFFAPLLVQLLVFGNDLQSASVGSAFSNTETQISLIGQCILILFVMPLCALCCSHLYADDVLWDRVFLFINPAHRFKGKASWLHWVRLAKQQPPGWGLVGIIEEGRVHLYFSDSTRDVVWKFDTKERNLSTHLLTHGHGLFLARNDASDGSSVHSYSRAMKSRTRFESWVSDEETISWPRKESGGVRTKPEIIANFSDNYKLEVSKRRIIMKARHPNTRTIHIGGGRQQTDGYRKSAGFDSIHAILSHQESLFVTDGAWVRRIYLNGKVITWGGKPLAQVVRRERPFLLGMAAMDGQQIAFQDTPPRVKEAFSPTLLVCDFSLRRVFGVQENAVKEAYRSEPTWAPTGIWIDGFDIYLLEYRSYTIGTEEYLRLLKFEGMDFRERPSILLSLPEVQLRTSPA